jgi:hypothetical protein
LDYFTQRQASIFSEKVTSHRWTYIMIKNLYKNIVAALAAITFVAGCGESNQQSVNTSTPPTISLFDAAAKGNLEAVKKHIAAGTDLNEKDPNPQGAKDTALGMAAAFGHVDVAKALINAGVDLDTRNKNGSTPLHIAAFLCYAEIVQALVDGGADKNARDNQGGTAIDSLLLPWADAKRIYEFIDGIVFKPIGVPMDYYRIKSTRPDIVEILK